MTDCVFWATFGHVRYVEQGLPFDCNTILSKNIFDTLRWLTHGQQHVPVRGGLVPFIVRATTVAYGSVKVVKTQHTLWTPEHHYADAEGWLQRAVVQYSANRGWFGEYVDKITLTPAIYLLYGSGHAVFSTCVPRGLPILAIQLGDVWKRQRKRELELSLV